jgi:hypothetical protein
MGEHDVSKHTRKIVQVVKEPGSLKHKVWDILLEIAIIVFAISLSLFVERYREHQQEERLEHNFLTALFGDLGSDLQQLKDDSTSYIRMKRGFTFFRQAYFGKKLQPDSALRNTNYLYNSVIFVPSNSRYEALKASGKLDVIENKKLQIDIVNLYQQTIPSLIGSDVNFSNFKDKLGDYTDHNFVITKAGNNLQQMMETPVYYNLLNKDGFIENITYKYGLTIDQTRKIMKEIKAEERDW